MRLPYYPAVSLQVFTQEKQSLCSHKDLSASIFIAQSCEHGDIHHEQRDGWNAVCLGRGPALRAKGCSWWRRRHVDGLKMMVPSSSAPKSPCCRSPFLDNPGKVRQSLATENRSVLSRDGAGGSRREHGRLILSMCGWCYCHWWVRVSLLIIPL